MKKNNNNRRNLTCVRYSKTDRGTDIIFIIEDSNSVNETEWSTSVVAVETCILKSTLPNTKFSILINDNNIVSCEEDTKAIVEKLKKYVRAPVPPRDAILSRFVSMVEPLFVRGDVERQIFFFVRNRPDPFLEQVIGNIKKLYQPIISSICFSKDLISHMIPYCSINKVFETQNLSQIYTLFDPKVTTIQNHHVRLAVQAINFPYGFGEDITLVIEFSNQGKEIIPKGLEVLLIENEYFESETIFIDDKDLVKNKPIKKEVVVHSKGKKNPADLPEVIEFSISHGKLKDIYCNQSGISLCSDLFIKEFIFPTRKHPIPEIPFFNILCFGVSGAGKSAFVNSLLTCLSDKPVEASTVGGSADHTTKDYTRFDVSQIEGLDKVQIRFFDIWGLEAETFKDEMLKHVVQGNLPDGYQMSDRISNSVNLRKADFKKHERRIHCILVFMPQGILDNEILVRAIAKNLQICTTDLKINPILVVTRASLIGNSSQQALRKTKISKAFNVPEAHIYLVDNYTVEKEKTMKIDKKTMEILKKSLDHCDDFKRFYKDELLRDIALMPTARKCPKCGESMKPGWDECPVCETEINIPLVCCGEELKPNYKKCPICKKLVGPKPKPKAKPTKCPNCDEDVKPNWDECPACETKL